MSVRRQESSIHELLSIVDTGEFEDNGWLRLQSLEVLDEGLRLSLIVRLPEEGLPEEIWRVECGFISSYSVSEPGSDVLALVDSHPVLWQHNEPSESLYFSRAPAQPDAVVSELLLAHRDHCEDWLPFNTFLNGDARISDLVGGGHGLLAFAPVTLSRAYSAVLAAHEMRPNPRRSDPPRCVDGSLLDQVSPNLQVLILGRSYFAGVGFAASRVVRPAA